MEISWKIPITTRKTELEMEGDMMDFKEFDGHDRR
jgi:hypothetical protein